VLKWCLLWPALLCLSMAQAATLVVSADGSLLSLTEALAKAQDGDTIELLPGHYTSGRLLIDNRRLSFKGVSDAAGRKPRIDGERTLVGDNALWTVRGGQVSIRNLEFRGARAASGEGSGVRLEGGELQVRDSVFQDNEYGIHALNDPQARLSIANSEFGLAPKVVGALYHLLNVGRIASLEVIGSRFQQGFEGHLIKTRARENSIRYNFIHDGRRGGASYEIEIAAGGLATVLGNVIGQGSETQNPVMVAYATELPVWDQNRLHVVHNTFIHYGWVPAWFVRVIDKNLPPQTEVVALNNLLAGFGLLWPAISGQTGGNRHVFIGALRDASTYSFELDLASSWRGSAVDLLSMGLAQWVPRGEFEWPVGVTPLQPAPLRWSPGAYQR